MSMNCGRAPPRKRYGKAPYWTRLTTAVLRELLIGVHSTPETRNTTTRGKITAAGRARKELCRANKRRRRTMPRPAKGRFRHPGGAWGRRPNKRGRAKNQPGGGGKGKDHAGGEG